MRNRIEAYRPASCLIMIALDWMVYLGTMTMYASWDAAWLSSTVAGSLATVILVALFESRAPTAPRHVFVRAAGAALAVAAPLPVLGSLMGFACLGWLLLSKRGAVHTA